MRHALQRIGAVALASCATAVALFGVGRLILTGDLGVALPSTSQASPVLTASPTPTGERAVLSETGTPSPSPSPSATPTPAPTPAPLALTAFRFGGRTYVGIIVSDEANTTFAAPFAGTVEVRTYQFIDGEVRVGSSVPTLPYFPYISVVASDRKIIYRPGAQESVTEVVAANGTTVGAGDPLFRLVAAGRSSWATFYNASAPYHVVVSLQSVPAGRDLDPAPYLTGN